MRELAAVFLFLYIVIGCAVGASWPVWVWLLGH